MATIQSVLEFQDKMSAEISKISKTLTDASASATIAKSSLETLEQEQKEWKATLDTAIKSNSKNSENIRIAQERYDEATKSVNKTKNEIQKYEKVVQETQQKIDNIAKKQEMFNNTLDESNQKLPKINNNLTIFGVSIGSIIGNFATKAIDSLRQSIGTAIETASDLAEVQNVVDVAFGDNADTINKWANTTLNAYGLNELSAKKYVGTMGAMLKSSGFTGNAVMEMSTKITELSGDMASFYNLSNEEAFNKIRSGIAGVTMPLKQLGIDMSEANLSAFAMSQGLKGSYSKMSEGAKMMLRYQYLLNVTKDAQGDFTRTQNSFANQQKLANENWLRLSSTIANIFIPALTAGYQVMNNAIDFLVNNFNTIIPILTAALLVVTAGFIALKAEAIGAALSSAAAWISATAPLWIVIGVIALISAGLNALGLSFQEQAENILISFNWIITGLKNIWIAIQNVWTFGENAIKNFADNSGIILANLFVWIAGKLQGIAKLIDMVFKTNLSDAINNFSNQMNKAQNVLSKRVQANSKDYKSFEANDIYTNQAKAQKFMSGFSGVRTGDLLGKAGAGAGLDGLTTNTSGGKALKTQNQGDIGIKEEDMELLHDLATRDFMLNYQQLTPQITIPGMVIHEEADVNQVIDRFASAVTELVDTNLSLNEGSLAA